MVLYAAIKSAVQKEWWHLAAFFPIVALILAMVFFQSSLASLAFAEEVGESSAKIRLPLQPLIDKLKKGEALRLEPGVYAGPIMVDEPITIDGQGHATIDAGGKGSVIYLDTDGAVIRNLRLTNSGSSHNDIDSGVQVRGSFNVVKDNVIDNCLFGIDLQQSENNIIRRNIISSHPVPLGQRGDAIRLWYSFNNKITGNTISDSRDTVVWYSKNNVISGNSTTRSRYALHFMYAQENLIENNHYTDNSVGVFLMYSDGVVLRNNYIAHALGPTGVGLGMKETSGVLVEGNRILYNSVGLGSDVSPFQPDTVNIYRNNLVAYNGVGLRFLNDWPGNVIENNTFTGNIVQVTVTGHQGASHNSWDGNYWDTFEGFDRDGDNIGDTPYELYAYSDRLWMDVAGAQFFKGSPLLEVLSFIEQLAPFSDPVLLLRDDKPLMSPFEEVSAEEKQ